MDDVSQLSDLARARHLRVAVAESLTSGTLAGRVGDGAEASEWFAGGIVAYTIATEERVLARTVEAAIRMLSFDAAEL
ncbi:CinA family protein [Microbacterium sp. ARD32]|uniref:CinA family protein n=1 Tax=Microbacterium sp. ARD32 TaxID=2962577 RepID=UPI0028815369|nr:CinA family protein [Microbacterium sp. ARD32]MDT0156057.1 CinA family protein [Microbacterium sp. ARD32]